MNKIPSNEVDTYTYIYESHKILMQTSPALTSIQSNSERCEVVLISFQAAGNFVVYCEPREPDGFFNTRRTTWLSTVEEKNEQQTVTQIIRPIK